MRPDMHKVICERERPGSRAYAPNGDFDRLHRNRDAEDTFDQLDSLPRHESMTKRLGYEARPFNENLEPLRRYLEKQVGRPWDKVKGEMSRTVGRESVVHRHVWEHVKTYVSETIVEVDGKLFERVTGHWSRSASNPSGLLPLKKGEGFVYLYVHPRTGILRQNKDYRTYKRGNYQAERAKQALARRRATGDPMIQLHKLDGIWYRVHLRKTEVGIADPLLKYHRRVYDSARDFYGLSGVQAVASTRRALSKKDLKALGLSNDAHLADRAA